MKTHMMLLGLALLMAAPMASAHGHGTPLADDLYLYTNTGIEGGDPGVDVKRACAGGGDARQGPPFFDVVEHLAHDSEDIPVVGFAVELAAETLEDNTLLWDHSQSYNEDDDPGLVDLALDQDTRVVTGC